MSMKDFVETLSDEQKAALLEALNDKDSVASQTVPEEVNQETTRSITEDFTMHKKSSLQNNSRRMPVKAKENTWTDTGEFKEVATPNTARTPRNRQPPQKKNVTCHVCGKSQNVNASIVYGEYYRCDRCTGR
jgi:hypothetical protein